MSAMCFSIIQTEWMRQWNCSSMTEPFLKQTTQSFPHHIRFNSEFSQNQLVKKCHIKENRKSKAGWRKLTQTVLGQKHMINKDTHPSIFCGDEGFNIQGKKQDEGTFRIKQTRTRSSQIQNSKQKRLTGGSLLCWCPYDESRDVNNQT